MITTETEIMGLVVRIEQARAAEQSAWAAARAAREVLKVAEEAAHTASLELKRAENALLVAAGGTDMSFALGL
jgi:hypothetical protein